MPLLALAELVSEIEAAAPWVKVMADSEEESVTVWPSETRW